MSEETITFNLELNVEKSFSGARKIELILFRVLGLWNRLCKMLGIPDDSPMVIVVRKIQEVVMVVRQLHTALVLTEAALVPGAGPIQAIMAGLGIAGAVMTTGDFVMGMGE